MTSRAIEMPSVGPSAPAGLTQAEAERRLAQYGRNDLSLLGAQLRVALGLRARLLTTRNLFLPASVAASALLAMAALHVPALQSLLNTQPVGWAGTGLATAAALAAFVAARLLRGAFHRKA
ncbi:cation-transporting P-type ATPase [Streptomyces sp. NPDC059533]|uniref:cation-transporting P-type ATPase n=1 Tax=unclassified Streptomyces TaxID=2593676 RepID=UPI00369A050F